jgi:ubiquinone/menaquinone biosynthesis C-methylase UbiE
MQLDPRLSSILFCPQCHGDLIIEGQFLHCISCGRIFSIEDGIPLLTSPKSNQDFDYLSHYEKDARVFDYFEERTGATAHSERRLREYILSLVPNKSQSILDVGCGSAWVAKTFQKSGKFICSLDVSTENPRKAMECYPSLDHVGVAADAYHLPFNDDSFDVILATEIIEHVHNPKSFVSELMRVVKTSGVVIISTPYKEKIVYELCIHCQQLTPHNAHLHSWDESLLRALFVDSIGGWEFYTFNNKFLLFARTYPLLQWMPFGMWKTVDKISNSVLARPVNCILKVKK